MPLIGRISFCFVALTFGAPLAPVNSEDLPVEADKPARLRALSREEAWRRLPREMPPLPAWARILAEPLPRTTAAMLHLDFVHRAANPLDPILRGKIRWIAAQANRCAYSRTVAEADLKRAGVSEEEIRRLAGDHSDLSAREQAVLHFARQMTLKASEVTDEEFSELLEHFGAADVVAMVHTLAHANFQDRIFLALGVTVEPDGPLPPFDVHTDPDNESRTEAPPRPAWDELKVTASPEAAVPADWLERSFSDLQRSLAGQKARASRIPIPDEESLGDRVTPGRKKVIWSRVSVGYQPELTLAWFDCMGTFQQEAKLDRVFSNSMFWVITRSNDCFY